MKLRGWFAFILSVVFVQGLPVGAKADTTGKLIGVGAVGGVPQLLGAELSFLGWGWIQPGITFGSVPVNSLLNSAIPLSPIPINISIPGLFNLYPSASYSLFGYGGFAKLRLTSWGLIANLLVSKVTFTGSATASLKNELTSGVVSGVVSGSFALEQWMVGPTFGIQASLGNALSFELALGGGYLLPPSYSLSLGGSAPAALSVLPGGTTAFDDAKSSLRDTFDSAVRSYRALTSFVPFAYVSLGYSF